MDNFPQALVTHRFPRGGWKFRSKTKGEMLKRLLKDLQQALIDIPPSTDNQKSFDKLKGTLPWPTHGQIVASFGSARKVGNLRWDGVLIAAQEGREIRTVARGQVAFADCLRGFGLLIIIDHGDGYMSLYGHNQSLYKELGDWVEAGEIISAPLKLILIYDKVLIFKLNQVKI